MTVGGQILGLFFGLVILVGAIVLGCLYIRAAWRWLHGHREDGLFSHPPDEP
jgi:hypothetical protein